MYHLWQDQIASELRTLRHQEKHEQLAVERRLLRTGHASQETARRPGHRREQPRHAPVAVRLILAGVRRICQTVAG